MLFIRYLVHCYGAVLQTSCTWMCLAMCSAPRKPKKCPPHSNSSSPVHSASNTSTCHSASCH